MNKNENKEAGPKAVAARVSASGAKAARRKRQAHGRVTNSAGSPVSDSLGSEARRLLDILAQSETRVLVDPTDEGSVIVHRKRAGISVGAGRFARAVAETLVRQDLAVWDKEAGQGVLSLSAVGRSYLRRAGSPDAETAFFQQHRDVTSASVHTDMGTKRVRMDADESPLDWLRRRKDRNGEPMIDEAAYQAGERLRTDIMLAGLLPGVTARWDAMPSNGGPASPSDATDRMVAARQRIRHAFDAVGSDFADLLMDLCGFLKGLELIERERQWPQRSAKIVVRLALARLAEHYGIEAAASGPAASRGIRTWRAVVIEGGRA
ncbi:DUF6456 domain-containing protein [Microvirga sp. 2YAF29]|uniref:DUF6456 domain-containing protein n=1 Tax=Microvirga sp. 2YAF29 TaxID=3233031 RepID=UPI003F963486